MMTNSREFHFPMYNNSTMCRESRRSVRFAGWKQRWLRSLLYAAWNAASRTFSRENCTDGWVFARNKVSCFHAEGCLCRSIARYSRVLHRVTRYAAWILTRRNCTYAQLWCNSFDNNARPDNKRWTLARISYAIISRD